MMNVQKQTVVLRTRYTYNCTVYMRCTEDRAPALCRETKVKQMDRTERRPKKKNYGASLQIERNKNKNAKCFAQYAK